MIQKYEGLKCRARLLGRENIRKLPYIREKMATNTSATPFDNIIKMLNPPRSIDRLACCPSGATFVERSLGKSLVPYLSSSALIARPIFCIR